MAFENQVANRSFIAAISFASLQFTFAKLNSSAQLAAPTLGGDAIGVVQDKPAAGDPGAVCRPGDITKVQCAATIAAGGYVSTDATGKAIPSVTNDYVLGIALAAGASGGLTTIVFQPRASKF